MNTPAHLLLSALVLGRGSWRGAWLPISAGALMPDLPMFGFYAYQRAVVGAPEARIWSHAYFEPGWQLCFDLFNSIPLLAIAALFAWRVRAPRCQAFLASMILHCLGDLPLHHDDAHAHFLPLSGFRFESPVSYWDPRHHGRLVSALELLFVVAGAGALVVRSRTPAWRWVGALALVSHALLAAFAIRVWLGPAG